MFETTLNIKLTNVQVEKQVKISPTLTVASSMHWPSFYIEVIINVIDVL